MPSSTLPGAWSHSVASMRASTAGWRFMTLLMKLPTLSVVVAAAAAVNVVQHSSTGSVLRPRDTKWSHDQTPLKPACSAAIAVSRHQADEIPIVVGFKPMGIIVAG